MLALAQAKAEHLGVAERTTLLQGTVGDLPTDGGFDAATCVFVLHFLPDADKLALLRGIASRVRPGAPLVAVSGAQPEGAELHEDLPGIWQQYGQRMGMPAEPMEAIIAQLTARPMHASADYIQLFQEAGFTRVATFLSVLRGGISGWLVR